MTADNALSPALDDVIDRALAEQRIVGTVVLVSRDGEIVYSRAAGLADREAGAPMAAEAVFRLASVTKAITAATALALADRDVLALDAPVSQWLPDFRPSLPDGSTPDITIAQLLTHTSGLSYGFLQPADGPYLSAGVSDGLADPDLPMEEQLRRLAGVPLFFPPGAAWLYSLSLDVLGAAIERAAGKPLPDVVAELILRPLGMAASGFYVEEAGQLVTPYLDGAPPRRMADPDVLPFMDLSGIRYSPSRALRPASFPSGGAGMVGSAADVLRFLEAVRAGGGDVLSPASAQAMLTNQIGDIPVVTHGPGWGFSFAGAVLKDPAEAASPLRAGTVMWGGVYGHAWQIIPDRGTTLVSLSNTGVEGMNGVFPTELGAALAKALA